MFEGRKRSARVAALVALAALVIVLAAAVAACGDKYEGTWVKPRDDSGDLMITSGGMTIKKSDNGYDVSFSGSAADTGGRLKATEKNGKLEVQNPMGGGMLFTATVDGDKMTISLEGHTATLQRK